MKKIRIFAAVSILGLCAMAAPAMAEDVTLNALFMKQAGYSEEDVTAMTQAFTESTGIQVNPTYSIATGVAIIITVMAFNLLGDALRDALDPKMRS